MNKLLRLNNNFFKIWTSYDLIANLKVNFLKATLNFLCLSANSNDKKIIVF